MITSIGQSIDALKEEYGLDRELVIEAMKEAVKAAARKQFKSEYKAGEGIQVEWSEEQGMLEISAQKMVVEEVESPTTEISRTEAFELTGDDELEIGDILLIPLPTEELGRIAAQAAKQILMQKIREAIRKKVYEEYIDRKGELINGLVKRFERGDMIVDLGTNLEALLPRKEQARGETWNINERLRVVISDVVEDTRPQQVIVSRASAELLKRLFEMEVPEIYDGTVTIKSAVREPGDRAKIAVSSNEKDVDPVGACVGMKGARVQSVIKELRGEKIDIIEWSDEPSVFAANALSPAKVSQVRITDIENRKMEVIVTEDQLSLAIGKFGQNVRLATRLVGWDIDIVSEDKLKREITRKMGAMVRAGERVTVDSLDTIPAAYADRLKEKGIEDIEALAGQSIDTIVEVLDVSFDEAQGILESAQSVMALKDARADAENNPNEGIDADGGEEESEGIAMENDNIEIGADLAEAIAESGVVNPDNEDLAAESKKIVEENAPEGEFAVAEALEKEAVIEGESGEPGTAQEFAEEVSAEASGENGDETIAQTIEESTKQETDSIESEETVDETAEEE